MTPDAHPTTIRQAPARPTATQTGRAQQEASSATTPPTYQTPKPHIHQDANPFPAQDISAATTTPISSGERATQVVIRGETIPLGPDDPRQIDGIRLHGRFLGGSGSTLKYFGRSASGYHFVKVLLDDGLRADFENETTIAAKLTEVTNLPQFTGSGMVRLRGEARPYYSQRLLDGPLLLSQIQPYGLSSQHLVRLATDLAVAIKELSERGLAHGDIKPEHIIDQGHYILVDLGSGRSSNPAEHPTSILNTGTLAYAAPERHNGGPATIASDIFSWGIVVLCAATGGHPLPNGARDLSEATLGPRLSALPEPLRNLVAAALRANPEERPSAEALAAGTTAARLPRTAVLTNDLIKTPQNDPVVLSRAVEPFAKGLAILGDLRVGAYRLALIAVVFISAWITYALVVGG